MNFEFNFKKKTSAKICLLRRLRIFKNSIVNLMFAFSYVSIQMVINSDYLFSFLFFFVGKNINTYTWLREIFVQKACEIKKKLFKCVKKDYQAQ
jgi:hypothetical protein